jgi:hypothetical protein
LDASVRTASNNCMFVSFGDVEPCPVAPLVTSRGWSKEPKRTAESMSVATVAWRSGEAIIAVTVLFGTMCVDVDTCRGAPSSCFFAVFKTSVSLSIDTIC